MKVAESKQKNVVTNKNKQVAGQGERLQTDTEDFQMGYWGGISPWEGGEDLTQIPRATSSLEVSKAGFQQLIVSTEGFK